MEDTYNEILNYLINAGFKNLREIPNKGICGLHSMLFTTGLMINLQPLDFQIYEGRYCFHTFQAAAALEQWNGQNDPPGNWIKYKGRTEYNNPNYRP
jgi:hypothetical protein